MPTNNPKVSAYVPQHIFDRFKSFYEERKLSMSQAVTIIFSDYFQVSQTVEHSSRLLDNSEKQRLEALEQKVSSISELHSNLISELQERLVNLSEEFRRKEQEKGELLSGTDDSLPLFPDFKPEEIETSTSSSDSGIESELLVETEDKGNLQPLSERALVRRLHKGSALGYHRKNSPDTLLEWIKSKDPDGLGWEYSQNDGLYYPASPHP
jgi:hypothetical protein